MASPATHDKTRNVCIPGAATPHEQRQQDGGVGETQEIPESAVAGELSGKTKAPQSE